MTLTDTISNLGELSISMRMLNGYLKINKAQTKIFSEDHIVQTGLKSTMQLRLTLNLYPFASSSWVLD